MPPTPSRIIGTSTGLVAFATLLAGCWAGTAPRSFYLTLAPYPPYSQHLIRDIGAFQIGLGACLVAGLLFHDVLSTVLVGNTVAGVAHFASHLVDRFAGGHGSDPATYGAVALLLTLLTLSRWLTIRTRQTATPSPLDQGDAS